MKELKLLEIIDPPKLIDEEFTKKKLGPFYKTPLPRTNQTIDMRFAKLPSDAPDTLKQLIFDPKFESHHILIGTSGCGKTRMIFDVARQYYTVFFECGTIEEENKRNPGTDRLFASFFNDIQEKAKKVSEERLEEIKDFAKQRIALEVASRLLFLRLLEDKMKGLTPERYLVSQLNGAQKVINRIKAILRNENTSILSILIDEVLSSLDKDVLKDQGRIIFAVDEVNVGYRILKDRKIWQSPKNKDPRGVLTPFIQFISNLTHGACTIYAGTSISMSVTDTIQSDIGKPLLTVSVKKFPILTIEDVKKRLSMWLNLGDEELKIVEDKLLIGRPRFSSMIPHHINPTVNPSKTVILETAISTNKKELSDRLRSRLISSYHEASDETKQNLLKLLDVLYIGSKLGLDRINIKLSQDLINVGIASLHSGLGRSLDYCIVEEPLVNDVLTEVYELLTKKKFGEILSQRLDMITDQRTRGHYFQLLCTCLLKNFCNQKPNLTVFDFLEKLYGEQQYPKWTKEAKLNIESAGDCEELGFSNDIETIKFMIDNIDHGLLLKPQDQLRPDLFSLQKLKVNDYWSLLCSTKLVRKFYEGDNDKHSTNFDKLYWNKTGTEVNSQVTKKREALDSLLKTKSIRNIGSLRLHIVIHTKPQMKKLPAELIEYDGNDIVAYFNEDIFKKFCSNATEVFDVVYDIINKS